MIDKQDICERLLFLKNSGVLSVRAEETIDLAIAAAERVEKLEGFVRRLLVEIETPSGDTIHTVLAEARKALEP